MILLIKKLLFLFGFIFVISCNSKEWHSTDHFWIGGEIINPKTDFIILYKGECIIDTVKLNSRNFFLYKAEDLPEGLYSFHHNEFQMFYAEPGDSLMLRVNTVDFDESLTYTGRGAEKNNFLMELFLSNESDSKLIMNWYMLAPSLFEQKLDSIRELRLASYKQFVSKFHMSSGYQEIANASIDYDYYSKKEKYTAANAYNAAKNNSEFYPEDFHNYRTEIDLGSETLRTYYPYYRFLNLYFDNISLKNATNYDNSDKYTFAKCKRKVEVIDSMVTNDSLKNSLLRNCVVQYLLYGKGSENQPELVDLFLTLNTNSQHHREVTALSEAAMKLQPGNRIPNVLVVTTNNVVDGLINKIKRPSVVYFWSFQSIKHYKEIHLRASKLATQNPDYDFIGINTDTHFKKWREIVNKSNFNSDLEFQLENVEEAGEVLLLSSMNKAFIIDAGSVILEDNTSLFSRSIDTLLSGFLNR